jgi:metallo-beta-lactamase class B
VKTAFRMLTVAMTALGAASCAMNPPASPESISGYVTEAEKLAGKDLAALLVLCKPAPAARPAQELIDKLIASQISRAAPEPGKAFDNLYFVGGAWASAWALTTSKGVILIDALNNEKEAEALIDGGMRKLGLDPSEIKYIVVTHAHGDHYGGAEYIAFRYRSGVVVSEIDWKQLEGKLEFNSPHWGPVPEYNKARDLRVKDGDKVAVGEGSLTTYITPGHTLGTITPVFEVKSGGRTHKALLWGGTAFNFGKDVPRLQSYIEATERMANLAKEQGIDVMLSNHAGYDGTVAKLDALRKGAASHPFVIGNDAVVRGLQVMGACAKAQRDRFILEK